METRTRFSINDIAAGREKKSAQSRAMLDYPGFLGFTTVFNVSALIMDKSLQPLPIVRERDNELFCMLKCYQISISIMQAGIWQTDWDAMIAISGMYCINKLRKQNNIQHVTVGVLGVDDVMNNL